MNSWLGRWIGNTWVEGPTPPEPVVPPNGQAHCGNKLCGQIRPYDVLPATKSCGIPAWAFCRFCGDLLDIDLEGDAA